VTATLRAVGRLVFGARVVGVDWTAHSRRIAIVGPSGAGKSSLLRALCGLAPLHGEVTVRGSTWEGPGRFVPPWERGIGLVPQDATLFPHRSVRDNLAWSHRGDVSEVAEALGIAPLLDRMPRNLSGGERQRVAVGRALLAARTALLLDEPFAALDRARRDAVAAYVDAWAAARDLPVVLVSHDARDVANLADEIWEVGEAAIAPFAA